MRLNKMERCNASEQSYLKGVTMKRLLLILILLFPPVLSIQKPLEDPVKINRHSLKTMTPKELTRLSEDILEFRDQDKVEKNGCQCSPKLVTDMVTGIGTSIVAIGSIVVSIIQLFIH